MKLQLTYAFLRIGCLPMGILLIILGIYLPDSSSIWGMINFTVKITSLFGGSVAVWLGGLVIHNVYISKNASRLNPAIPIKTWAITQDNQHNSNVDLVWFHDSFYLAYAASPYHFGSSDSRVIVKRSRDGILWEQVAVLNKRDLDIRDPKFAVIGGKLFIYVLINKEIFPLPHATWVSFSEAGTVWSELTRLEPDGWLFGRPKTRDGKTWYAPAYWYKFHKNALFTTTDGIDFEWTAIISSGRYINEPEIEFQSDGSLLATGRADYLKESFQQIQGIRKASTIISCAQPPYATWQETAESQLTRLDGPVLFSYNGQIYAIGRAHTRPGAFFLRPGSVLGKKRAAIFAVNPNGLTHLTDLPSCGDTSYAGVVIRDDWAYIAYYTNHIKRDFIWLFGMLEASEVRAVKINLRDLEDATKKLAGF